MPGRGISKSVSIAIAVVIIVVIIGVMAYVLYKPPLVISSLVPIFMTIVCGQKTILIPVAHSSLRGERHDNCVSPGCE